MHTLYYRAKPTDLPEILELIDEGTARARLLGIALGASICDFKEFNREWWKDPAVIAQRVTDISAFRTRVVRAMQEGPN